MNLKSPFPGMDPYLEQHWRDVHHRLCTYACDALQPQLRPALVARIEERLVVETEDRDRSIYPDVKVAERGGHGDLAISTGASTALAEPLVVTESEPATEGYINIFDAKAGGRLVTVIEFLSPSNKLPGEGQKQYRQKQQELRQAGVSLVEIDLLRGGEWVVDVPPGRIPRTHRTPYKACVRRGRNRGEWEFYRLPLDQPLPAIRIPLREKDADARLDLQMLINQTYANGAYDALDYTKPTDPPLEGEAAAWVNELLKSHRR